MAISPLIQATGNLAFLNNVDAINQPGASPSPFNTLTPAAQNLAAQPPGPSASGVSALQQKSQGQYSNKQFVAPFKYEINVEGTWMTVDLLGKRIVTETENEYKSIASLSATVINSRKIDNARMQEIERALKASLGSGQLGLPPINTGNTTLNAAAQQFLTGTSATAGTLTNRFTQFTSLISGDGSQLASNIASSIGNAINTSLPSVSLTQSLARVPGMSIVTNTLGNLPGGPNLTNMLNNPIGATTGLLGNAAQGLNLQLGLPSLNMSGGQFDLGSLPGDFSQITGLATDIFHNGPPTSLQGIIALEKQVKGIICNFQLPNIKLPSFDDITSFKFPKLEDIEKQIKKEFDDLKSNIINQFDIVKMLKEMIPDPQEIYEEVIKELTTCNNSPNSEKNSKGGQSGS